MHVVTFQSGDPTEHVLKVLGCLQRMNFELADLAVTPIRADVHRVRLAYRPAGTLGARTFVERVRQVYGIEDVVDGELAAEDATVGEARVGRTRRDGHEGGPVRLRGACGMA